MLRGLARRNRTRTASFEDFPDGAKQPVVTVRKSLPIVFRWP